MPAVDFGDDLGSPYQQNNSVMLQQYIQQHQNTGPHLLEIPKASPFHLSDWVGGILDRADQLQQQAQQNEKDRNRFKSPVLPQFQSPLLNSIDQQIESKPTNSFADIVKQQAPKQFPSQPAPMQLPDAGEIQQQQGGATNPTFEWAISPQGQDFLTSGGAEKFNFGEFAKNPLQYLTQNNNMREFQWGTSPDTRQTLLNRGVPESTLNDLHQYLSTPEGGGKAKPINAAAAGPVESVVGSATKSGVLGGMLGGALPFVNAPLAALDMALSSENGTGVSPQELAGTALQLGIGKATGPLSGAVASKAATGGLKGTIANLLARAGVDATANAGLTAGQITAAGQNPISPESLKAIGESAAIGGVAGAGMAGLGGLSNALTQIPEHLKTPAKVAGTSAVTYAAARASGMNNQDALALSAAIASGYTGARLSELAARGALPEWLASPIRSALGSVTEFTDESGKPVSMSDFLNTLKPNKIKIRYNADGEALAITPGIRERLVVGKRGEPVNELKSRAAGALKAGADAELDVRPGETEGPLPRSINNTVNGTTYDLRATADDGTALYAGKPGSAEYGQNHYVIRYPDGTLENHTTLGQGETSSNAPRIPKAPPGGGEWHNVSNGATMTSPIKPREAAPAVNPEAFAKGAAERMSKRYWDDTPTDFEKLADTSQLRVVRLDELTPAARSELLKTLGNGDTGMVEGPHLTVGAGGGRPGQANAMKPYRDEAGNKVTQVRIPAGADLPPVLREQPTPMPPPRQPGPIREDIRKILEPPATPAREVGQPPVASEAIPQPAEVQAPPSIAEQNTPPPPQPPTESTPTEIPLGGAADGAAAFDKALAETPAPEPSLQYKVSNPPGQRPWALEDETPAAQANIQANQAARDQTFGTLKPQRGSATGAPQADILGPTPDTPPTETGAVSGAPTQDIFTMSDSKPDYGIPSDSQVKQTTALFDEYGDIANQYTDSNRLLSRATGPVGRMVDPASKYKLPEEQSAFKSAVAAANLEEAMPDSVFQRIQPLKPLIGDGIKRALLKGGLETAIPAASVLAYVSTDGTLPDWLREAIIVGGFGTSGILSDTYRRGFLAEKPWMKVARKASSTLDPSLAKLIDSDPNKRFFDIMENPNDYNLSPAQLQATQAFRDLRDARLTGDNAARIASGLSPIKYRMNNAIGHYYDIASLGEAGIQMALPKEFTRSEVPGVLRRQGLERERVLGGTWRQVWAEHPEIKPLGDVTQLLAMELQQSTAVRARSALLYGLKKDGLAETFPSTDGLPKEQKLAADKAIADRRAQLMNAGWEAIPGLDGSLMHPSAARVVKDLFQSSHTTGSLHTFIDTADKATQVVRAAMFSMDLSAWTLQGAQLFMQSPVSMLTHIVPLMRGTFSEDFYQRYKAGKFAAGESGGKFGANIGREFHGIEDKNLPEVIRKVENAGFGRFLPMARQIIFEQNKNVESLLERLPGGKLPVIGDAARLAELIPPATYAAYQVKNGDEIDPTTMAIMIGIGGGIDLARGYLGKSLADGLSKEGATKAGVRAAKGTNRIGGVLNRAGMGIGAQQSKLERTFLFRSPAMTRNALELTGLALLNPGAEGQFARAYLVKSAFAYTAILATAKLAATGQMDSFDPSDPNSILSVQNLGRLQIPGLSTVSPSSPLLSMARAMLYQDRPDDEKAWEASRMNPLTSDFWHDKGLGISDWLTGRTPDIVGAGTNAIIQGGITNLTGARIRQATSSPEVNPAGALGDAASHFLPLSAQSALTTGLAQKTALGKALGDVMGIQPNPAYDSLRKQITGVGATLGGLNVQPEYPGATLARLRDEQAAKLTNGDTTDYFSLDNAQRKQVRDALAGNAEYEKALKAVQGSGADSESPTDQYFADRDSVTQTYAKNLNDAAQQVLDGKQTKGWFKDVVKLQNGNRSAALDQIDATYSKISANRPGTKESVLDYLKRNEQPVDKAVDGWYDLFNQATGPDGLDFDKLDKLQKFYMLTLSPAARSYVKQQTASTSNPVNSLVAEYDQAKKDTSEFWTLQDRVFAGAKQNLPFFQNFNTLDDFNKFLQDGSTALGGALSPSDLSTLIGRAVPQVKQYLDQVSYWEKKWRLTHPEGDRALVQWYGFSPADKIDYTGRLTGVAQVPESRSAALLSGKGKNSAAQTLPTILQFLMESGNGDVMNMPVIRLALQGSYNTKK